MPLKLLGKKSWNPYLDKNLSRVKTDEDAFAARDEELQKLRDAYESDTRLARLRGEESPEVPGRIEELKRLQEDAIGGRLKLSASVRDEREDRRKRRKIQGEDDTDRDIRVARQQTSHQGSVRPLKGSTAGDVSIEDSHGHLQLFTPEQQRRDRSAHQLPKADVDRQGSEQGHTEVSGMRFSDASGYSRGSSDRPWYAEDTPTLNQSLPKVNVFGKEDRGRGQRALMRVQAADPMAMMRAAQAKIRESSNSQQDRVGIGKRDSFASRDMLPARERRHGSSGDRQQYRRRAPLSSPLLENGSAERGRDSVRASSDKIKARSDDRHSSAKRKRHQHSLERDQRTKR